MGNKTTDVEQSIKSGSKAFVEFGNLTGSTHEVVLELFDEWRRQAERLKSPDGRVVSVALDALIVSTERVAKVFKRRPDIRRPLLKSLEALRRARELLGSAS